MWLADGFHRYDAHVLLNVELMECEVREGTRQDAILWAAKANEKHGVRRTPADREKTVVTLVNEFPEATQAQIARMADMPDSTVGSMLNRLGYRLGNSSGGPKRKEPEPIPSRSPIASALAGLPQQQREVFAPLLESAGVPEELALEAAANLAGMDLEKRAHVCELAASPKASDRSAAVAAMRGIPYVHPLWSIVNESLGALKHGSAMARKDGFDPLYEAAVTALMTLRESVETHERRVENGSD